MESMTRDRNNIGVTYKLPLDVVNALEAYAADCKREDRAHKRPMTTKSEIVAQAVRDYLKKHRDRRG